MEWLKNNWFRIGIVLSVLIVALSICYYYVLFIPEKERFKQVQESAKQIEERQEREDRVALEKKEYIAKRKQDCYGLFEKERKQWNNTQASEYDEEQDVCRISYKEQQNPKKSKAECHKLIENEDGTQMAFNIFLYRLYSECLDHTFSKEF